MSAISIQPRKVDFDVSSVPRHWNGGDPVVTRFFDALSVHFPEGERFFIQSVRHFQDQVTDQRLREDIRHFIRQEGQHGIVHDRFNDVMEAQGICRSDYPQPASFYSYDTEIHAGKVSTGDDRGFRAFYRHSGRGDAQG